jgi:hypothetical protein
VRPSVGREARVEPVERLRALERRRQLVEAALPERRQQRLPIGEVAGGRRMAHARAAGELAERHRLQPLLDQEPAPLDQERLAQGAVVIAAVHDADGSRM